MRTTIVSACLRDGRGGSPTAVLWESGLSDAERCQVPAQAQVSHAVFVQVSDEQVTLRFFTSTGELPACGHGTVAALAFLAAAGPAGYRVTLRAGGRRFAGWARREGDDIRAAFEPGPVTLREASAQERALAVGALGAEVLAAHACVASVGRPRLLVPIANPPALRQLAPDLEHLHRGCDELGLLGCYVHTLPDADGRLAARMFAPAIGVPEDIANVNSTACLAAKLGVEGITVDMGDALGTPATITAGAQSAGSAVQIHVGGAARITGEVQLPR